MENVKLPYPGDNITCQIPTAGCMQPSLHKKSKVCLCIKTHRKALSFLHTLSYAQQNPHPWGGVYGLCKPHPMPLLGGWGLTLIATLQEILPSVPSRVAMEYQVMDPG